MRVSAKNRARVFAAATGVALALSAEAGRAAAETGDPDLGETSVSSAQTEDVGAAPVGDEGDPGSADGQVLTAPSPGTPAPGGQPGEDVPTSVTVPGPAASGDALEFPRVFDGGGTGVGDLDDADSPVGPGEVELPSMAANDSPANDSPAVDFDAVPAAGVRPTAAGITATSIAAPVNPGIGAPSAGSRVLGLVSLLGFLGPLSPAAPAAPAAPLASWTTLLWWTGRSRNFLHNHDPKAGTPTVGYDRTTGEAIGRLNATDPDGDPLSYQVTTGPSQGTVTVNPDGSFV